MKKILSGLLLISMIAGTAQAIPGVAALVALKAHAAAAGTAAVGAAATAGNAAWQGATYATFKKYAIPALFVYATHKTAINFVLNQSDFAMDAALDTIDVIHDNWPWAGRMIARWLMHSS